MAQAVRVLDWHGLHNSVAPAVRALAGRYTGRIIASRAKSYTVDG